MGKEACALHEKAKRWFTHDGDGGDSENHPLSFAVLDPLSVHPLASMVIQQEIRQLSYFEVEVVGGASVGVGTLNAHAGAMDCHVGWRPTSYGIAAALSNSCAYLCQYMHCSVHICHSYGSCIRCLFAP